MLAYKQMVLILGIWRSDISESLSCNSSEKDCNAVGSSFMAELIFLLQTCCKRVTNGITFTTFHTNSGLLVGTKKPQKHKVSEVLYAFLYSLR